MSRRFGRGVSEFLVPPPLEEGRVKDRGASLLPELEGYVAERLAESDEIPSGRKQDLQVLAGWIAERVKAGQPARLVFICTHNSRRSQMAQLWARTAALFFAVSGVESYSGGTEVTTFYTRAVAALRRAGFRIEHFNDGKNPIYEVSFEPEMEPFQAFSKVYTAPPNPTEGYAAVMTCADADAACPTVVGADERIAVTYDDPKVFDGTRREVEAYDERCAQIAREMLYVFSEVAHAT